ncbi:MAG: hypothetical protein ACT4PY_05740 [Armatimonadota bacterium]
MRRRLALLIVVAGAILGGVVSISSPFGVGHVIVRRPIVLLQDAANRVVRALLLPRGPSAPAEVSAPGPAVASGAADVGLVATITVEPSVDAAARLTRVRRGARRAEDDGHEGADRARSQAHPEGDSGSPEHSGAVRIAGRDQSGADGDAVESQQATAPIPSGSQVPPSSQPDGGAAAPPGGANANDGPSDVKSPSTDQDSGDDRTGDSSGSREPGHGGGQGGKGRK